MRLYLDCYPCVLNQTLSACRALGVSDTIQRDVFSAALQILVEANPENPPVELVARVQSVIKEKTGVADPYYYQKQASTKAALAVTSQAEEMINHSNDPFEAAVRLSIAGNIIDFGVSDSFDLPSEIARVMREPFAVNDVERLKEEIDKADTILYLADNAGETVFDRLLIETIGKDILYAVKETPILNDALAEDAIQAGIGRVAQIISSGVDTPGTLLSRASAHFLDIYRQADVIISKGQGNYEALSGQTDNIFFLLQAKCESVAALTGAPVGGLIVKSARG